MTVRGGSEQKGSLLVLLMNRVYKKDGTIPWNSIKQTPKNEELTLRPARTRMSLTEQPPLRFS
jgi:hypothetical protein